jgi:hypothetical protein
VPGACFRCADKNVVPNQSGQLFQLCLVNHDVTPVSDF